MATKGYSSYHGRVSPGKIALIVVLVLILLGAIAYLVVQNYLVYDESGQVHLELPFFQEKDNDGGTEPDGSGQPGLDDADFDRVEPEFPHVKVQALHGVRLPDDCLWWGADYIMTKLAPEDMVLAVKRTTGGITYATEAQPPQGVVVETGRPLDCLKSLLSADRWTVGHIVCFSDSAFARARTDCALTREDGALWYDDQGQAWLDPTDPEVLRYLTALCKECGELGFDEVLFDNFYVPSDSSIAWDTEAITPVAALEDCAENLTANLTGSSIRLALGTSVPSVAQYASRVFVTTERANDVLSVTDAMTEVLPDPATQLVFVTTSHDTRFDASGVIRPLLGDSSGE